MRILIIADREDWVLGTIAQAIKLNIHNLNVGILYTEDRQVKEKFLSSQWYYDVVHFMYEGAYLALKKYLFRPCAMILWHLEDSSYSQHLFEDHRVDALSIPSHQWVEYTKKYVPADLSVYELKCGIDTSFYTVQGGARQEFLAMHGLPDNTLILGFSGNAAKERKGLSLLFNTLLAWKKRKASPIILRMSGKLSGLTIPDELNGNLFLSNFLPREEMPAFYSSLDYYLCTSEIEGYGYPVLEAMCCERIVISTPVGVAPEIIRNGENGYIIQPETYVDEFIRIAENTALNGESAHCLGKAARETILSSLSWDVLAQNNHYWEFYSEANRHYKNKPLKIRIKCILGAYYQYFHKRIRGW
jgi:glycosyltransferase involved in cell wall biosynthesis